MVIRSLIVVISIHHKNTEKVADVFASVLNSQVASPQEIDPDELQEYSLIGFGSGIYDEKHHRSLLGLADRLTEVTGNKAFIFSTSGVTFDAARFHTPLREKLQAKGYRIVGEFNCHGFNTNSFLKYFGGMNKGRPNAEDLKNAEEFALKIKRDI
ncbi:MAG: flavodoxin family protein [Candidatus Thorarchaeota archaeon]